ncbi:hypothetical protein JD844_006060 [Phrynosoma platyrhinos]|uniref:Solute carrier family 3 member 2 N-terminal domain-containing protein n=1 Tax=Phrynosoma platyrhinos TaxID=52577 RepID=A0ABQ7TPB0_PHRPL|nr:hypothetical protein JD844_006060 [Phrynosoma platyrhinos]
MGKVEDTVLTSQVSGEHLPLLGQAAPITTYLSQDEVVQQAGAATWVRLRKATFGLLGALFACMLIMAVLLLLTMPRPRPPLAWVLMVWDESDACNISRRVPRRVILTCYLPGAGGNLSAQAVAQQVERVLGYPGAPWPSWTVPQGLPVAPDLGEMLGVLLLTLPGVPLLPGGKGSPVQLDRDPLKGSTNGHRVARLYHSLLALHANSYPLRGIGFAPLPLVDPSKDIFAFLRPGPCSSILVVLNLGSQPLQLNLEQLSIPIPAKVLFSTRSLPEKEVNAEGIQLAPHQAILLKVPRGHIWK